MLTPCSSNKLGLDYISNALLKNKEQDYTDYTPVLAVKLQEIVGEKIRGLWHFTTQNIRGVWCLSWVIFPGRGVGINQLPSVEGYGFFLEQP
jgi:hypothetical protein